MARNERREALLFSHFLQLGIGDLVRMIPGVA
jgi:hypothetical protein